MKFLLLNQTFHPDVMASGQYLTEVAVRLVERGHQVTVVTSRRAYDHPESLFPKQENWRGIHIRRVASTGFGKGAKWRRAADFASFSALCSMRLAALPRHDVVVALTSPPLISFLGGWLARLRRSRFIYWVMDFNPDEAIAAGWLRPGSVVTRVLDWMSRFSLKRAATIIALDRFMRDRIAAKGIAPEKIAVIPPWSHNSDVQFDRAARERFRQAHGLEGKFVVMYSGNHSPCHPLDTLLEAARQLARDPRIVFCFVGGGSEFRKIQQMIGGQGAEVGAGSGERGAGSGEQGAGSGEQGARSREQGAGSGEQGAGSGERGEVFRDRTSDVRSQTMDLKHRTSNVEHRTSNVQQPTSNVRQPSTHNPPPSRPSPLAPRLSNILCLPYQPLAELAGSLSAADLHVVVMGNAFVGLVHPCKIYNTLAVEAPVLYIGPEASHLSEILAALRSRVCVRVGHGDSAECVRQIRRLASEPQRGESKPYQMVATQFSQSVLLPRLVEELERSTNYPLEPQS